MTIKNKSTNNKTLRKPSTGQGFNHNFKEARNSFVKPGLGRYMGGKNMPKTWTPLADACANAPNQGLMQAAQRSTALQHALECWPPLRGLIFGVGPIKNNKLKLFVANPASISRIKQNAPSLVETLRAQGFAIDGLVVSLHSQPVYQPKTKPSGQRQGMGPIAANAWSGLADQLQDPDLREATLKLIRRHEFKS